MQKGDVISRQAAIDALGEKPLAWTEDEYELGLQNQWQSDVDALNDLPSTQPEQRWILCSEGLPRTSGNYNVTRKISDGFECRNISDTCYFDGSNTWHDDTRVNHRRRYLTDVIAWMPLPEPWKEKMNEDDN